MSWLRTNSFTLTTVRTPAASFRRASTSRRVVDVTTRASTTWSLDGVGCAGLRSGDEQLLRVGATRANTPDTPRCPLKPINLTSLCEAHAGRFVLREAVFELMNGQLFVTSVDHYKNPPNTDDLSGATEQWARNLAPMERLPMVKVYLFLVSFQRAWSVITSQIAATVFSDKPEMEETNQVLTEVSRDVSASQPDIMVDGKPLPKLNRWLLRPGAVLRLGDSEYQVHRNVFAHA